MQTRTAKQGEHVPLELAHEAVAKGREAAHEALIMGQEAAHNFLARGRDAVQQQFGAATDWASTQAKDHTLRTLVIAAGVGALVALLLARR